MYTLHFGWQWLERNYLFLFKGQIMVENDSTSVVKFRYKLNSSTTLNVLTVNVNGNVNLS